MDGKLGALTLHDVTDAQVQINGADAKAALTITLNNADGMTLASEVQIKKLTATSVTGDSVIAAPALASGTVKGDFIADLTIGGVVGLSTPLGTIKITGRVEGDWILAQGGAKAVTVGSSQGWTFVAAGQIASITSNGDMIGGSVQADTIGKLTSKGEFRILVEALGQDAKGQSLGTLTVGRATDATLNVAGGVKSIKAVEWLDGGIAAGWIGSLTVSGNKAASIAGDFEIDLTLTDVAVAKTLGTFKAAGSILDGQWDIAGVVGSITALATCDGWTLVAQTVGTIKLTGELRGQIAVGGQDAKGQSLGTLQAGSVPDATLDAAGGVKTIKVVEWLDGEIKAGWINALAVSGNKKTNVAGDLAVDVTLTDASVAKTLSKLTVAGTLLQARIFSAGVVGSVTLGAMDRSQLLVGTSDGVEGPVESPDDFDLQTVKPSLASFTIKGLASAPDQPSMIGSWVTAWNIGKATVKFVAAAAPDEPFGFTAGFVGSLAFLADGVNSNEPITLKQLDIDADLLDVKKNPTGVILPVDEFTVVLV